MSKLPTISTNNPGADNGGVDKRALLVKETKSMIIENTMARSVTEGHIMIDTAVQASGAQWYSVGQFRLENQAGAGVALTPQDMTQSRITVEKDDPTGANLVTAPHFDQMSEIASAERSRFTRQISELKAKMQDVIVFGLAVKASTQAAPVTGNYGGKKITAANMTTDATVFMDGIMQALALIYERGMPFSDVRCFVSPKVARAVLWTNKDLINRDFDGNGSFANGQPTLRVMGIPVTVSAFLPTTDLTVDANAIAFGLVQPDGTTSLRTKYAADFSKVAAILMTSDVVARVDNRPFTVEYDTQPQNLTESITVSWSDGYGVVNAAGSIVLANA